MPSRLGFLARFLLIWVAGLVLLAFFPVIDATLADLTANHLLTLTRSVGLQATLTGTVISIDETSFDIEPVCTSAAPTLILAAAMIAFPCRLLWRVIGIGAGALVLWGYNLLRLLALGLLLRAKSPIFDFAHLYLWQTVTLLFVGICYVSWIRLHERWAAP